MNPVQRLAAAGQSPWLDFVRRTLMTGGELRRLIDEDGLTGVTSNPSIFGKAIGGSTDYDEDVERLAKGGEDHAPLDVFLRLAIPDIRLAADLLRPVYERTARADGFVSFEVEPRLARDVEGTVAAVREAWRRIDRPNVLIKIPGTAEGLLAIEQAIAEGINVNVTLLFDVDAYEGVVAAYQRGIERRVEVGEPVDRVASVASFFVSRVDTAVDALLPEGSPLRGLTAIANAKLAYERFRALFAGDRWERLASAGARVQRPLWASTSTKNPEYPDTLYVEALVGRDTVNTMPMATIDAFRDHGLVREGAVSEDLDGAHEHVEALALAGIDLADVTRKLLEEGIAAFARDFDALLETIDAKLKGTHDRERATPAMPVPVVERLERLDADEVIGRIWRKDHTVWKDDPTEITNRLGWLNVTDLMHERVGELEAFAKQAAADGFQTAVLLGMGGSSLAPEVFARTFGTAEGHLELIVLDTTHPVTIDRVTRELDLRTTMFVVASKTGTTVETISHFKHFWALEPSGRHFVAITDPDTPLEKLARDYGFRAVFRNPADIGGRYSALSYFGLVPAALSGAPLHEVLDRAEQMMTACAGMVPATENPGAALGALMGESARTGRDKLTLVLAAEMASFGSWAEQLIAESTGKQDVGIVPIVGEDLGRPDVYGSDRVFVAIGDHPGLDALEAAAHPVLRIRYDDREQLGGEFFRWEMATAVAGSILGINAFDQPNVQEAKDATKQILASGRREDAGFDDLRALLDEVRPGDYVAILAYLDRTDEAEDELQRIRMTVRDRFAVATTVGFGPRFLHSTGQLHKGGANTGVFVQIVDRDRGTDVPIPGADYSFGSLIEAQALGDLRSLEGRGRRVARVTMDTLTEVI